MGRFAAVRRTHRSRAVISSGSAWRLDTRLRQRAEHVRACERYSRSGPPHPSQHRSNITSFYQQCHTFSLQTKGCSGMLRWAVWNHESKSGRGQKGPQASSAVASGALSRRATPFPHPARRTRGEIFRYAWGAKDPGWGTVLPLPLCFHHLRLVLSGFAARTVDVLGAGRLPLDWLHLRQHALRLSSLSSPPFACAVTWSGSALLGCSPRV